MRTLKFEQTSYLTRTIISPVFGEVQVAPVSLNNKLMDETGGYTSDAARLIDEQIFFYVDNAVLGYPDKKLTKFVEEEVLL